MLPDGSQLKGVMIPRYDEHHKLTGVLKAKVMKLVNDGVVEGTSINIEFSNPDPSKSSGRAYLEKAVVYEENGTFARLDSDEPVEINTDGFSATGRGLRYRFDTSRGFLIGPGTTTISNPSAQTSMNTPGSSLRATALAGLSLIPVAASGAAPPPITEAEVAALHADARTSAPVLVKETAATKEALEESLAKGETASAAATAFLVQADLPAVPADEIKPATEPLDVKAAMGDTVVKFDGGMFFDATEGVLVYRGNVTVNDPRFNLSGANELKIFFSKKEPKPGDPKVAKDGKDTKAGKGNSALGGGIGSGIGDVEKIVATGRVVMDEKPKNGQNAADVVHASGAVFSYNMKTDEVIISGGYPWFVRGPQRMRALEPNLSLRIRDVKTKDPKVNTEGHWEQFFNLDGMKR